MFLTNFNSSIEFAISSRIPSGEGFYQMETSPPTYTINLWNGFGMVGDFSGGYSQKDCNLILMSMLLLTVIWIAVSVLVFHMY